MSLSGGLFIFLFYSFFGDDNHNTNRYRIAGVYAPANGEFSTRLFSMPNDGVDSLYINVDAHWHGYIVTGGCDEGCAAYVMVELQDENNDVIPGFERNKCTLMNVRILFISTEIHICGWWLLVVLPFFFFGFLEGGGGACVCACVCKCAFTYACASSSNHVLCGTSRTRLDGLGLDSTACVIIMRHRNVEPRISIKEATGTRGHC